MLNERLISFREKNDLSIEELALKLEVSIDEITMWENDEASPTLQQLIALADIYNVSLDDLIGRSLEKKNKKAGYFARAYIKLTPEIYSNALGALSQKTLSNTKVISIIAFVLAVIFIFADQFWATACLAVVGFMLLSANRGTKRNHEILVNDLKKNQPNLEYYTWLYDDKFELLSISKNTKSNLTFNYDEITNIKYDEKYIYFIARNVLFVIDKKLVDGDLEKIYTKLNKIKVNKLNENDGKKSVKTLLTTFFVLSIISFFIPFVISTVLVEFTPIPEFDEAIYEYLWIMVFFIPIPIISIILGSAFKSKGYKSNGNIVVGSIMTVVLFIFSLVAITEKSCIGHDYQYIHDLENKVGIILPDSGDVSIYYYEDGTVDYALARFDESEIGSFITFIQTDPRWLEECPNMDYDGIDYYEYYLEECEYFCIYDVNCGAYNTGVSGNHQYHERIYLAYDIDSNLLVVVNGYYIAGEEM